MSRGTYCSVSNKLGQRWEFRKERISQRMFSDNRPVVLRKRRFTRKQRKSVSIEPETGLILAVGTAVNGKYSSSDEDDIGKSTRQVGNFV